MKKIFTFIIAGIGLTSAAYAQKWQQTSLVKLPAQGSVSTHAYMHPYAHRSPVLTNAKVTAITPFFTDTFNSNSFISGGWTAGGNTGSSGTWKFTKRASNGTYGIGAIRSTSAAGGWMLYDSDSIGALFNASPQIGTLTSPSINCATHQYVAVRFQQYAERFQDSFFVQASNDGGTSWTSYPVLPNMALRSNDFTDNPEVTTINISPVAGNMPNVKVRFYYSGTFVGGGYNWLVDDFQLVDLDPIDIGLAKSGVVMTLGNGSGLTPFGTQPFSFADTAFPVTHAYNYGGTPVSSIAVEASITSGAAPLYNQTITFPAIPINAYDSLADYSVLSGYKPPAINQYLVPFSAFVTGDANASNNEDTAVFRVSDSSLCVFSGFDPLTKTLNPYFARGDYYLHAPVSSTRSETSYYMGSFFEIGAGKSDTITSVSVCIAEGTTVNSQIQVELYKYDNSIYQAIGKTFVQTLTAADISTANNLVFITLPLNIGLVKTYAIADAGNYVMVAKPVNPTSAQTILISSAQAAAPENFVGNYGITDSASGASYAFGQNLAGNYNYSDFKDVPALVANFGDARRLLGTGALKGLTIGQAYPNPANTFIRIPVASTINAQVKIRLSNIIGQDITSLSINLNAGQSKTGDFSTAQLAPGMYFYTIESGGETITRRISVTH